MKSLSIMMRHVQISLVLGRILFCGVLAEQRCEFLEQLENKPDHANSNASRHLWGLNLPVIFPVTILR